MWGKKKMYHGFWTSLTET